MMINKSNDYHAYDGSKNDDNDDDNRMIAWSWWQ